MAVLPPGSPAPGFSLLRGDGEDFSEQDLQGRRTVLAFYPFALTEATKGTQGPIAWADYA